MADKKDKKDDKKTDDKPVKRASSGAAKGQIFLIGGIAMAAVFLPTSVLLFIGMMPTIAALLSDPQSGKAKVVTVGAINLAGCTPFLFDLWMHGHSLDRSFKIIMDPKAIIVMYAAAATGYLLDWSLSAIISSVLYQRGLARQNAIQKRQEELTARWGEEVTGLIPLDQSGFPVNSGDKQAGL